VTDQTPEATLTEQDEKDLATLLKDAGEVKYNPVLRIWSEILSPENLTHGSRVTIPWSNAILSKYHSMTFALMPAFVDRFHQIMTDMADALRAEIASDPDCLKWHSVEEDVQENRAHYIQLLHHWQKTLLVWETIWDCTHPEAAAHVAALGEAGGFFFGETGLAAHLSQIGLEFDDADQADLAAELQAYEEQLRAEVNGE
jgi:hypothetical protein